MTLYILVKGQIFQTFSLWPDPLGLLREQPRREGEKSFIWQGNVTFSKFKPSCRTRAGIELDQPFLSGDDQTKSGCHPVLVVLGSSFRPDLVPLPFWVKLVFNQRLP